QLAPLVAAQVHADRALARVAVGEVAAAVHAGDAVAERGHRPDRVGAGARLDLDHVGAVVGERLGRERACAHPGEVGDPDAGEGTHEPSLEVRFASTEHRKTARRRCPCQALLPPPNVRLDSSCESPACFVLLRDCEVDYETWRRDDVSQRRPRLLLLDDWEHRMRNAPAAARLRELADVTVLDRPLAEVPDSELRDVRVVVAIRERTRFDRATFDRLPALELILQTGGHAYHVDLDEARRRGIVLALWRSHDACEAAMRELTFGLAIAALRRFPEATRAGDAGDWPGLLGGTLRGRR